MTMAQRTAREVEAILTDHSPGPQTSWVSCTGCRARGELTDTEHLSDADVAARLGTMGWTFAGWARWLCAKCSTTPKIHSRIMDQSPSDQAGTDDHDVAPAGPTATQAQG